MDTRTPPQGLPLIPAPEQAEYDARQDGRLRDHSQHLHALDSQVAALVARVQAPASAPPFNWSRVLSSVLAAGLIGVLGGAFVAYQSVHDHAARLAVVEQRQAEAAAQARADAGESRATHDAIIRLTATVEQLSARVAALSGEVRAIHDEPADLSDELAPRRRRHR